MEQIARTSPQLGAAVRRRRTQLELLQGQLGVTAESEFRISLAGAQAKTALLRWKGRWHIPHGATPTTHIVKPEIGRLQSGLDLSDSVENEFFCLKLSKALGLPSADVEIHHIGKQAVLVVERFDRRRTNDRRLIRLLQEDCCQAVSVAPTRKYESEGGPGIRRILELLKASDEPEIDRRLFLKAQILLWLLGATDGHAKNFSIQLLPGGRFRLAPIYDVMSAQPYVDGGQIRTSQYKLAMGVGDNRHYPINQINVRHFEQAAASAGMDRTIVAAIMNQFKATVPGAIESATSNLPKGPPRRLAEQIAKGIRERLRRIQL
jgi:serine/threonine-protein kinase HipA